MGPITTQPFRKLPVAAKLGKPGHQFDDAGARARIALVVVVVVGGVPFGKRPSKPGYYGGSTPVLLATTGTIIGYS
jgi:hypothetical protein